MKLQKQKLKKYGPVIIGPFLFLGAMILAQISFASYLIAIIVGVAFGFYFDTEVSKFGGRERFSFLNFFLRTRDYLHGLIKFPKNHFAFRIVNILIPTMIFLMLSLLLGLELYVLYLFIGGLLYEGYYQFKLRR